MIDWGKVTGFDWDKGDTPKIEKRSVSMAQAEQVFSTPPYWGWRIPDTAARNRVSAPWVRLTMHGCCIGHSHYDIHGKRYG
jgi:hypothetical protein